MGRRKRKTMTVPTFGQWLLAGQPRAAKRASKTYVSTGKGQAKAEELRRRHLERLSKRYPGDWFGRR